MPGMWRWVSVILIVVILGRPIILIDNSACQETAKPAATAVDPLSSTPCHDALRLAEASTAVNTHACPCPAMWPPAAKAWTAVFSLLSGWTTWIHTPETAVNAPPNPPPRAL